MKRAELLPSARRASLNGAPIGTAHRIADVVWRQQKLASGLGDWAPEVVAGSPACLGRLEAAGFGGAQPPTWPELVRAVAREAVARSRARVILPESE